MTNTVQRVQELGQSVWYDNMRRGLLPSGELKGLIALGVSGLTSNPTIFEKAIAGSADYDQALAALAIRGAGAMEAYEAIALEDIRAAADLLRPVYDRTRRADGFACLEVSPTLAHDTEGTVAEALRLFKALDRPNAMIKVPGTPEGVPAIRRLLGQGVNVNVTLIFSLDAYAQVREAYIAGLEDLRAKGGPVGRVASVASFFVSRVDTAVDSLLEKSVAAGRTDLKDLLGKAAIANAQLAYAAFRETFDSTRFAPLRALGARPQRPLWASTGTKNPAYSDVLYIDTLVGRDTVNTMPPPTLSAFLDHGRAEPTLELARGGATEVIRRVEAAGISMQEVTGRLLADGVKAFADSFESLLANVERKKAAMLRRPHAEGMGPSLETGLQALAAGKTIERIWQGDHTVWRPDPTEITDRLGWLRSPQAMSSAVPTLEEFGREVKTAGVRHIVLLGMGGSSLGPEVLRRTFGSAPGYPELIVLDSTVPTGVEAVTDVIDVKTALFVVSSKSGTTIEPLSLYKHFRRLVVNAVGPAGAGSHFAAITDPGTPLEALAKTDGFRRVFLNQPDIGGRYSVLSYFGLVPAALMGLDVGTLLQRARQAAGECSPKAAPAENPGAWLGAVLGRSALDGRDKLTLVLPPGLESLGLWVEQLVAESTGKDGRGIVPVVGEPLLPPKRYGQDRLFVHLRLAGAPGPQDEAMEQIKAAGHPLVTIGLTDRHDLGSEFFRWEFAVAVAGAILGIHPFDQPDVQRAKDVTSRLLKGTLSGRNARPEFTSVAGLLDAAQPGDYLAVLAYCQESPEMDWALERLRLAMAEHSGLATTAGYGPRYLHSTGQLHKGGPNKGLFLVITAEQENDIHVPGEAYTFNALAEAQALGDMRALRDLGRRIFHLRLPAEDPKAIIRVSEEPGQKLAAQKRIASF